MAGPPCALLSIPTPDHYWPLMDFLGSMQRGERVSFPVEGIAHGSVSAGGGAGPTPAWWLASPAW
ncbi:MAG: hypothetical protein M1455_05690 [Actinobacteria bacterium]|nr:hypothetical protein [Actinomycetota bacterium]